MRVELDPQKRPVKVKPRRYPPAQRQFLTKYINKLVEMDFLFSNPDADWQAAPLCVPKPGSQSKFRLAIDLRPVNAATIKKAWPMPHLDAEMGDFAGSTCFASLDFCQGYWQLPIHPESYNACGIVAPHGTYSSKRTLPGLTNATAYFQSTVEPLFAEMRSNMKAWLDDFNLFAKEEKRLLELLARFFEICAEKRLFLSAKKCQFFTKSVKWCGRVISAKGYTMSPANSAALQDMNEPRTADELCQFIHCCRWMATVIPNFVQEVAPLVELLEAAYKKSGRRTKRSIKNIELASLSWGARHATAFKYLQDSLRSAVQIAHPDPSKVICVYTDASKYFWSGIVTQVSAAHMRLPREKQEHEPLAFLGGAFKGAELNWSTFEQEAFAIFQTFEKVDYLLMGEQEVHVFTDHRNLLFIFAPLAFEPTLGRHVASKVQRWAIYLSRFAYIIEHVDGDANVFADILTRWVRGYRSEKLLSKKVCGVMSMTDNQIVPSATDIELLTFDVLRESQREAKEPPVEGVRGQDDLIRVHDVIWIPEDDLDTKVKLLVLSHCGASGHRGVEATASILKENFTWKFMDEDVREFVGQCIHCLVSRTGDTIPRPLGRQLHGQRPNEVLHLDFLYLGESSTGQKYALVLREDFSGFVWLFPFESATSEAAAEALASWIATFGCPDWIITDQGAHFRNRLLKDLTVELHVQHHFTTAYCPWSNGTVERVCREVLRALRALLSELKLAPADWPSVLEIVQSVLNQAPLKRLGRRKDSPSGVYRCPLEVFTSCRPRRPLLKPMPIGTSMTIPSLQEAQAQRLINIEQTQEALREMHRDVHTRVAAARRKAVARHNEKTNIQPFSFHIGDFVLVRGVGKRVHKMQFIWLGPRRMTRAISDWTFEVESLSTGKREIVHIRRMMLYRACMGGKRVDEALLRYADHNEAKYQEIDVIDGIRESDSGIEILIRWKGLPDEYDYTWEPLQQVYEDVPHMLRKYLRSAGYRKLKEKAVHMCPFN